MNEEVSAVVILAISVFIGIVISEIFNKIDMVSRKLDVVIELIKGLR